MNTLMQWLGSEAWAHLMQALLHTLWIGALLALGLYAALRRMVNPFRRYRACVGALAALLFGGLAVWAWLQTGPTPENSGGTPLQLSGEMAASARPGSYRVAAALPAPSAARQPSTSASEPRQPRAGTLPARFRQCLPFLALAWLLGLAAMLARAGASVARAEKLRAATSPLMDEAVLDLIREGRRRLEIGRRIRLAVTDQLTSPAVVGVIVPTLIIPLALITTMPASQLQLVLLHELAHIRRGDYLANLFQFMVESLLFFNPAVWWLNRQVRLEREACCDALAAGRAGDPLEYARALAWVAELALGPAPAAAPAFADRRHPSALRDRIQRLLVPGYRPALRLTWKALLGSLFLGGLLLLASALGARWTVKAAAQLLTPRQRIDRIEQAMKDLGEPTGEITPGDQRSIPAAVVLRTRDGSPLPGGISGAFISRRRNSTAVIGISPREGGVCGAAVPPGDLFFYAWAEGFAPAFLGPIDTRTSNEVENLELTLDPGFPVTVKVADADSGRPLADATLEYQFWLPQAGQALGGPRSVTTDDQGMASLPGCAALPLGLAVEKDGYEKIEKRIGPPRPNARLYLAVRAALPLAGLVTDRATSQPIPEAEVYVLRGDNAPGWYGSSPDHPGLPLAVTDARGRFQANRLPRGGRFWLIVRADGHADTILEDAQAGQTNLQAALGQELRVRGRITGNLDGLARGNQGPRLACRNTYEAGNTHYGTSKYVPVRLEDGTGYFEFVSPIAGVLNLDVCGRTFTRDVTAPVEDWLIDLPTGPDDVPSRAVTLRFEHPSKVPPEGTVAVLLPEREPHKAVRKEIQIREGEVSFRVPIGREFSYEASHTVGYWFERQYNVKVPEGAGPLIISVPVIPAGAIYAQARGVDGRLAGNVGFSIVELKRSPAAKPGWPTTPSGDSWSQDGGPRTYIASPLPLGGTYCVVASQANNYIASEPIQLTGDAPDQKVELAFHPGATIAGKAISTAGRPLAGVEVSLSWAYRGSSFGLPSQLSGQDGAFSFEGCNPRLGRYSLSFRSPGWRSLVLAVSSFKPPLTARLEPGLKLTGRIVDADSGRPVVSTGVRAFPDSSPLPSETSRTDENGRFTFDTLNDTGYRIMVDGCNCAGSIDRIFKAGAAEPILYKVTVVPGAGARLGAGKSPPLIVTIDAKGSVRLGTDPKPLTIAQLKAELVAAVERNPNLAVAISEDQGAPWGQVIMVMDVLKETNIKEKVVNAFVKEPRKP